MIIKIDTNKWATPAKYAEMKGQTVQVVFNWMKRGKVEVREIPELNLKLVKIGSELKAGKGSSLRSARLAKAGNKCSSAQFTY